MRKKIKKTVSDPKKSYLAKAKFKIGPPSLGGHSQCVLVNYKTTGGEPELFYSKDCKHFMQPKAMWSFEKYGYDYLKKKFTEDIDVSKSSFVAIYPSVYSPNQMPIEVLYSRKKHIAQQENSETLYNYYLAIPKRPDLRKVPNDKYKFFRVFSPDLDTAMEILKNQYLKWETLNDPKGCGRKLIYNTQKERIAEVFSNGEIVLLM